MSDRANTTLDDVCAVIGFSATLQLAAWFGDGTGNLYVPDNVEEGQLLVKLIGMPAAKRLSEEWGRQHLAIPCLRIYEDAVRKRVVGKMFEKGFGYREISGLLRMSERRAQQIVRELEAVGLIPIIAPKISGKNAGQNKGQNAQEITGHLPPENTPSALPAAFFKAQVAKASKRKSPGKKK